MCEGGGWGVQVGEAPMTKGSGDWKQLKKKAEGGGGTTYAVPQFYELITHYKRIIWYTEIGWLIEMTAILDDLYGTVDRPARILTAVAAYDGHDASILAINRSLRECGLPVEVIYMGYNKKVEEIVKAAVEEGVDCVAVSSYNGGHNHFFPALVSELNRAGSHAIVVGGGGGTISPDDEVFIEKSGVTKIYGIEWSLDGLARDVVERSLKNHPATDIDKVMAQAMKGDKAAVSQIVNLAELLALMKSKKKTRSAGYKKLKGSLGSFLSHKGTSQKAGKGKLIFITGDGGAGKSTITDEIARHFTMDFGVNNNGLGIGNDINIDNEKVGGKKRGGQEAKAQRMRCAILSIDPTTVDSGEYTALLGDRIRMNNIYNPSIFMRSLATRVPYGNFPAALEDIIAVFRTVGYDLIIVETPGTGQAGLDFRHYSPDKTIYVKTKEFGSVQVQLQKDQLLKEADIIVLNKIDREGSHTVFEQIESILSHSDLIHKNRTAVKVKEQQKEKGVKKGMKEGKERTQEIKSPQSAFATLAKLANDPGTVDLYVHLMKELGIPSRKFTASGTNALDTVNYTGLVPHHRRNYLGRIVESVRKYDDWVEEQLEIIRSGKPSELDPYCKELLEKWQNTWQDMTVERAKKFCTTCELEYTSYNGITIPKVSFPDPRDTVESLRFLLQEGLPGDFPYVNGVFPMRRETGMETTRQFAGLRLAEHTNERFHFLSQGVKNPRLSTAFDGITLYGDDSDGDPGSIGKIGEGGVSVDTLDDMKILYSGFDFREISTSMTINGPAPIILAMYFNVACDWMIEQYKKDHPKAVKQGSRDKIKTNSNIPLPPSPSHLLPLPDSLKPNSINLEYGLPQKTVEKIRNDTYKLLRGTVQADILKEIQAQNECIFQGDFAIKLMGDVQQFFVDHGVGKFYSISISGYHIGEAGATPVQEMAYTISNGFTYAENFMGRGMDINDIAPNFSFFFRNSHEIEWLATGPVMRKIWSIAMRDVFKANKRSQMFKFHTQTSGRALQIPEWDTLNPVRQTVHALIALLCNTNSLHVDSADEPLTTPGPKYVRQATMIPNFLTFEAEILKAQNLLSGSYAMREIQKSVQEAVLKEMERIDQEGGVGPATEVSYQRSNISQASCEYEHEIFNGTRPIIGRNVLRLNKEGMEHPVELMRPTEKDWETQIDRTRAFRERNRIVAEAYLDKLREVAQEDGNVFQELLQTVRYASLGQISEVLKEVGGRYSQQI